MNFSAMPFMPTNPAPIRHGIRTGRRASTPAELAAAAPPDTVSALDRGMSLLNCFRDDQRLLSATDLARLTGIPRPTVIRLAATLVTHRWLQNEADGERYKLGAGVVSLAQNFLAGLDVRAASRAPMQALAETTGGSVYLAVRDGLDMVLIEACRARSTMLTSRLDVGSRVPLPNSALGRAYLGAIDFEARQQLIESLRLSRGSDWGAFEGGLNAALEEFSQTGFCRSVGEFHAEINSVSVAMAGPDGAVMTFNCGGPVYSFNPQRLTDDIAPALLRMAHQIAADIGGKLVVPPEVPA
jgi:IclR family transcriptional regulator, positive regulator for flagellar biogenesis